MGQIFLILGGEKCQAWVPLRAWYEMGKKSFVFDLGLDKYVKERAFREFNCNVI